MRPPILHSRRLELRALEGDAIDPAYVGWLNDPVTNRFLEIRLAPQTPESVAAFVHDMNASPLNYLFGMFLRTDDRHIGNIKLGPIDVVHRRADVGLLIGEARDWGQGLASEAIGTITTFGFDTLALHKLTAGCYAGNEGSRGAFLKAGWREVCRRHQHVLLDGRWTDVIQLERITPGGA